MASSRPTGRWSRSVAATAATSRSRASVRTERWTRRSPMTAGSTLSFGGRTSAFDGRRHAARREAASWPVEQRLPADRRAADDGGRGRSRRSASTARSARASTRGAAVAPAGRRQSAHRGSRGGQHLGGAAAVGHPALRTRRSARPAWPRTPSGLYSTVNALAVDALGRVLLTGDDGGGRPVVLRLTAGGQRDGTFGAAGVWSPLTGWRATGRSVAPGPNGTVFVGLQVTDGGSPNAIVRLTAAGAHDVTYAPTLHSGAVPGKLVPLADGRLLFADSDHVGRVSASGALEFITRVFTPTRGQGPLALQGDGRVVRAEEGLGYRAATVGAAGAVSDVVSAAAPELAGATILPRTIVPVDDGMVVAGGSGPPENRNGVALARLDQDGAPRWTRVDMDLGQLLRRGGRAGRVGRRPLVERGAAGFPHALRPRRRALGLGAARPRRHRGRGAGGRARARGGDAGRAGRVPHRAERLPLHRGRRARPDVLGRWALPASGAGPDGRMVGGQRADGAARRQGRDRRRRTTT